MLIQCSLHFNIQLFSISLFNTSILFMEQINELIYKTRNRNMHMHIGLLMEPLKPLKTFNFVEIL